MVSWNQTKERFKMSQAVSFRCIICMLFYDDRTISADRTQACSHIYFQHDYTDKIKAGRLVGIVNDNEKRSASWLTNQLTELSILRCD